MKFFPRTVLFCVIVCSTVVGRLSAPPTADAAPAGCSSGYLCVYTDYNYNASGYVWHQFYGSNHSWTGSGVQDLDRSWFNNGSQNVCVYHGDYAVAGHFQTVALTSGTGYPVGQAYPAKPTRGYGESNRWIGSSACSSYP